MRESITRCSFGHDPETIADPVQVKETEFKVNEITEHVTMAVPEISCDHCVNAIQKAVGPLPGVLSVKANAETKKVDIDFDPSKITVTHIEAMLEREGYPVA